MNSDQYLSPIPNLAPLSESFGGETNFQQQQRKAGLASKLRQTINAAGKRDQSSRQRKSSAPNLTNLTTRSQVNLQKKNFFLIKLPIYSGTYFTCS
jgi:hypothetical protein